MLSEDRFSLHDAKQAIDIVRNALETIAVVESHRPPAQVEAEMTQFLEVVHPAAFAVHRDANARLREHVGEVDAGELAAPWSLLKISGGP